MPFLIPPSEFKPGELTQLGLTGTRVLQFVDPQVLGFSERQTECRTLYPERLPRRHVRCPAHQF